MESTHLKFIRKIEPEMKTLRIIPHHTALNSATRKLQSSLYELISTRRDMFPWQHRDGWYLAIKPAPAYWWTTKIEKERIEFYLTVPEDILESTKIKLRNFEQWKRCTVEEVEFEFPEEEDTDLYKMVYSRHDMFSLEYDYKQQATPVRDLLSISNELKEKESLNVFFRCEAMDRHKWRRISEYGWNKWEKGSMIPRKGIDLRLAGSNLIRLLARLMYEIKSLLDDLISGIEKTFFSKADFRNKEKTTTLEDLESPERARILATGGPSKRSNQKRTMQTYKTHIRFAVHSEDRLRRDLIARSVETAYNETNGDNSIKPVKINFKAKKNLQELSNWHIQDYDYNIMSVEEMGKLQQLPTKEVQMEFKDALVSNQRVEAEVPKSFKEEGIFSGTTELKGETFDVHIPVSDPDMTFTSRAFIGSPRMGKDQLAINTVVEANRKHGIGAIIPDVIDERKGHRGMADALRDHIPPENVIDINLGDFDHPVYLGLHSLCGEGDNERIASNRIAQELTNFLMGDDKDNHQTREYLREFAKATKGDLINIKLMCMSEEYRESVIRELKDKGRDTVALESFHEMSEGRQAQVAAPILIRIQELLGDEFLKPIFGQRPNPDVNFRKWMEEGKIVILRVPSRELGEEAVKTIMYWITLVTFLTRIRMSSEDKGVFLVLNEPSQFLSKGLVHFCKRLLTEGPKYKIAPIFLMHNLHQLPKDFQHILMSSSLNWHIFKNSSVRVYEELELYLEPTFTPDTAMRSTKRFHYIACWLDNSGEYQNPFLVKAPDLVTKRYETFDNEHLSEEHSKVYGRPIEEVLQDFQQRQHQIYRRKEKAS